MKILIVSAMFPPIRTGTSFYTKSLAEALQNNGVDIHVITVENSDAAEDNYQFPVTRIKSFHYALKNYFKHLRFTSIFPKNYKLIRKYIAQHSIDSVILVNHYLDIAFPTIFAAKRNKVPLFISVGTQMQSNNPIRNKILKLLDRLFIGNFILPAADKIISWDNEIDRYIKETYSKRNSSKSIIIPFGIDKKFYDNNYQHDYSKVEQIVGIGAVSQQRDYMFNIRVFSEVLKEFPGLKYKIIGHIYYDGPVKLAKELGIEDKVIFTGEQTHDTVVKELKNSCMHWMMLSAQFVGLGTSSLEAMMHGLPAISNSPENLFGKGVLKDKENYLYTDGKSVKETADKLIKVLRNQELRMQIGANAKDFVNNVMNWDVVARQFMELNSN